MSDYDDLVRRLRQNEETRPRRLDEGSHVGRGEQALAADAIERLQADLAAANAEAELWRRIAHVMADDGWADGLGAIDWYRDRIETDQ